jgi:predicted nucleotidyltransferase
MDLSAVAQIDRRLADVRAIEGVAIPLAIESGSRAWGFPSPDSDYDCRFVFVRPLDQYLTPWPRRDVIETPLEGELDVNGWDLGKALKLLLKGNAVIVEWLTSPIAYGVDETFRQEFLDLAAEVVDRAATARHYLHLGTRQRRTYFTDEKDVPLKKLFYVVRPAAALRWLMLHPGAAVAPMHFQTLIAECDPPREVATLLEDLVARKALTRELGAAPLPGAITAFVDAEFERASAAEGKPARVSAEARALAEAFFRRVVKRASP